MIFAEYWANPARAAYLSAPHMKFSCERVAWRSYRIEAVNPQGKKWLFKSCAPLDQEEMLDYWVTLSHLWKPQ